MARTESSSVTMSFPGLARFAGRDGDRTVVWLQGEHDLSTMVALADTLARAIALDDADLVLDLSEVQFMGAETVGIIVRADELLCQRSRSLTLRAPSRCARRVLELCGGAGDLDLDAADMTPETSVANALGSWVAVPAADRVELITDTPALNNHGATTRVSVAHRPSSADDRESAGAARNLSDLGGL